MRLDLGVGAQPAEIAGAAPGDELVRAPDVVMDRGFDLPAEPEQVWPWIAQLGKGRAGWYLPRWVERFLPRCGRPLRRIEPSWQHLRPGDVIPDWGGRNANFEIVRHDPPELLLHRSTRGALQLSWAIILRPTSTGSRVHLRLRMSGIRHRRLAEIGGGLVDLLTVAGLAVGLRERVTASR